jgi:hypothetical protein
VLVCAAALVVRQLALMVGNPLGALNSLGIPLLPHLYGVLFVEACRLLVYAGGAVMGRRSALVRRLRTTVAARIVPSVQTRSLRWCMTPRALLACGRRCVLEP